MKWGWKALSPLPIHPLEGHGHPGEVVGMLVDPLALEVAGQKHRKPFATDTDVSGLRGGGQQRQPI